MKLESCEFIFENQEKPIWVKLEYKWKNLRKELPEAEILFKQRRQLESQNAKFNEKQEISFKKLKKEWFKAINESVQEQEEEFLKKMALETFPEKGYWLAKIIFYLTNVPVLQHKTVHASMAIQHLGFVGLLPGQTIETLKNQVASVAINASNIDDILDHIPDTYPTLKRILSFFCFVISLDGYWHRKLTRFDETIQERKSESKNFEIDCL